MGVGASEPTLDFDPTGGSDGLPPGWTAQRGTAGRELNFLKDVGLSDGWVFHLVRDATMERNGRLRSRPMTITPNALYRASVWVKVVEGNARLYMHFEDSERNILDSVTKSESRVGEWVRLSVELSAPANAQTASLRLDAVSDVTDVYFDMVALELIELADNVSDSADSNGSVDILTEVNAASWGFDPEDSTDYLQAAIDSGADRVIVPNMGRDWIVRPLVLRSNLELVFEEGVVVTAKKGEYLGTRDSMFTARNVENLVIRGYGATLQMHKSDYVSPPYEKAEWRHIFHIRDSRNIQFLGLTLKESGGDGIYLGGRLNEDVVVRDVVADGNHRQGMSVISARNLLVEDSVFKNTSGTPPMAGIDFEPNDSGQHMENIVIRNSEFISNGGSGITFSLSKLLGEPKIEKHLSIHVEDVLVRGNQRGISVSYGTADAGQTGEISVRNCVVEDSPMHGIFVQGDGLDIKFEDCTLSNVASLGDWFPMALELEAPQDAVTAIMRLDSTSHSTDVYFDNALFTLKDPRGGDVPALDLTFNPRDEELPAAWQIQRGQVGEELHFLHEKGIENGWAFRLFKDDTMPRNGRLRSGPIEITGGTNYEASVWVKVDEGNARLYMHYADAEGNILASRSRTSQKLAPIYVVGSQEVSSVQFNNVVLLDTIEEN